MQVKKLWIRNFRAFSYVEINFDQFSILLGGNNSGKSSALHALSIFFNASPRLSVKDFHNHDQSNSIEISVTFSNFTPDERRVFGDAVFDNLMTVSREFTSENMVPNYSVMAMVNPAFREFREEDNGTKKRGIFGNIRKEVQGVRSASTVDDMSVALSEWEKNHPEACEYAKVRAFFGATNVAAGKLVTKTGLHLIPAVRDVSLDAEGTKSPAIALLAEVNKQTFQNKKEFIDLVTEFNEKLSAVSDPSGEKSLADISNALTKKLQSIYADSGLIANLEAANQVEVSFPPPSIKVRRDNLTLDVAEVGHGLQRAILFTIIQYLAEKNFTQEVDREKFSEPHSDIVILIEEPEIYQHPIKQRVLYAWLKAISNDFNRFNGIRVQVVIVTHSEKFLEVTEIDRLRLIRSHVSDDGERIHSVGSLRMDEFSSGIARHLSEDTVLMSNERFKLGLHVFELQITEGFFAEKIILVEGVSDKAIIEGVARSRGLDLNSMGISIVSVDGKTKMDKPLFAFRHFGIPVIAVFDNDKESKKGGARCNRLLQRICNRDEPVDFPVGLSDGFVAFEGNLEKYLSLTCGDRYEEFRVKVSEFFQMNPGEIEKTPAAVSAFVKHANEAGIKFELIDEIINRVV